MLNKIHQAVFWDSNILKLVLESRSFQYGNIQSASDALFTFLMTWKVSMVFSNEDNILIHVVKSKYGF